MDLNSIGIFQMASNRMGWLGARQAVLAQNVANANTPDYTPQELDKQSFSRYLGSNGAIATPRVKMTLTNPAHMNGLGGVGTTYGIHKIKPTYETSLDGNGVVVEEEMAKMDATRSQYDMVASIYQKNIAFINTALGLSSGN